MNKKGQIYIFAAVVISVLLFGLMLTYNKMEQKKLSADFKRISDNYNLESARFMNALIRGQPLSNEMQDMFLQFSAEFSSYARANDPNYELFYTYTQSTGDGVSVYFGNLLSKRVYVKDTSFVLEGCYSKLNANIQFGGLSVQGDVDYRTMSDCADEMHFGSEVDEIDICVEEIDKTYSICYTFDITKGKPQVMIFTGETELEQRQVYIGGKGFLYGKKVSSIQ